MESWKEISLPEVNKIDREVETFDVWMTGLLPYGKCRIKVSESQRGSFVGYANIRVINAMDNTPEGTCGMGKNATSALEDTIKNLVELIKGNNKAHGIDVMQEDYANYFCYSSPDDF